MFNDYADITFNWLNKARVAGITAICKELCKDVEIKRLAQERGVLGACKLSVRVHAHSWRESIEIRNKITQAVDNAGLSDSLTY